MKHKHAFLFLSAAVAVMITTNAWATDLIVSGEINISRNYDSQEGIVFDNAILKSTANVTAASTYEVILKPGTRIEAGARLVVRIKDIDGLDNHCEMTYFNDLTHNANDDDDGDQLTNSQECQLNTNPAEYNPDNDSDGLPDAWEVKYFGIDLSNDRSGDADGDGISNWIEWRLNTDPTIVNSKAPGLHYEYDDLGRIIKIDRVPSN